MFATILFRMPLVLMPIVQLPAPAADCELEVLTPAALEERALASFNTSIDHYVSLHRRLERSFPPEQLFYDPEDMWAAREALAAALRDARPYARPGNIFTPPVAQVVRDRLAAAIAEQGDDPADILDAINAERLPGMPDPVVNESFDWTLGAAMLPALLRALPLLPPELEYRFVDRSLVLIDLHANLVVDVLENALPPPTDERLRYVEDVSSRR